MICPGCAREVSEPHPACLRRISNGSRDRAAERGAERARGYGCGCRPESLCIQHGIGRMSQQQRDAILQQPSIRTPRRRQ